MTCKQIESKRSPKARNQCSLNYYKEKLYLFAGAYYSIYLNDLWIFNIKKNNWKKIKTNKNIKLQKCAAHKTVSYLHYIIFFGGYFGDYINMKYESYNDLWIYDIINNKWELINTMNKPSKRFHHSMFLKDNLLIIHGGKDINNEKRLNDCYIINIKTFINSNLNKKNNAIWIKYDLNIGSLSGHKMLYYKKKLINYIFLLK